MFRSKGVTVAALVVAVGVAAFIATWGLTGGPSPQGADAAGAARADDSAQPITITAVDYAFEGVPERVAAGTAFTLVNASEVEVHELVALRIDDDETRSVEELLQLPEDEPAGVAEMPAMVLIAPPASEGFAVVEDGTFREPGRYLLACAIPTGADPEAYLAAAAEATDVPPQVEGGPPHFVLGMFAQVIVE